MAHDAVSLESDLRKIRSSVSNSIDRETGKVDPVVVNEQAEKLKHWIADFESLFVDRAGQLPREADEISSEGRELRDEAWHTYETLLDLGLTSGEPPAPAGYGMLPSGYVNPETKTTIIALLRDLLNHYIKYRKHILKQ